MARNITITFADGTTHTYQNAPDDVTPDAVQARAEKEFSRPVKGIDGGAKSAVSLASQIPGNVGANTALTPEAPPDNLIDKAKGVGEAALSLGTGMVGGAVGGIAGLYKGITGGKYGTQQGVQEAANTAHDVAGSMTYQPRTQTGQKLTQMAGDALNNSGIIAVAPMVGDMAALSRGVSAGKQSLKGLAGPSADAMAASDAAMSAGGGSIRDLMRAPVSTMAGGGAAATDAAALRVAAANQLPVPMGALMTKAMRTRAKPDIQFENIAAKDPELGTGLRKRTVEVNQAALDNFDAFAEATGAQGSGLRPTGKVMDDYLIKRVSGAKSEVRSGYDAAAKSVEGKAPADTSTLMSYLDKYDAEAKSGNAPVINAVRAIVEKLDPENTGKIPLREFNEIRERVGKISQDGSPNAPYRKGLQDIVDTAVEENGGPLYRSARRLYENYQNEFKNAGAIDRLLRMKPGTKDRATSLEDMVTKSTLDAPSTDAVRQIKTMLTRKQDPEGLQAWSEVQGETARQMKERVLGEGRTESGVREVLPGKLSKMIREMDADGRLEVIFSKNGAQQWRDLADTVSEMKTVPANTVSSSGTAEVLAGLLDTAVSGSTGLPLPIASAINYGVKRVRKNIKMKKIDAALNPDQPSKGQTIRDISRGD